MTITEKYGMAFLNKVLDFRDGKEVSKTVTVNDAVLGEFLNDWSAWEIDELLMPDIEEALINLNAELQNGSATVDIYIYNQNVEFYKDSISGLAYQLPTEDFKEIVLLWRDFLQTPPLEGTKV